MTRALLIDLAAVLAILGWLEHRPLQRAYGVVLARHCEWRGQPWGCPVNLYRYGVTIQTPEGDTVRVRVSQDQLQLAAYGDLISGEVERDH